MPADSTAERNGAANHLHAWWAATAVLALGLGFALGRCSASPATQPPPLAADMPVLPSNIAKCIKVLDGDTIRVKWRGETQDIRILGIDCPETKHGKKLTSQAKRLHLKTEYVLNYGKIAKKTTTNWLLNRDVNLVFPDNKIRRDAFGRLLCYVEDQGVDIGERLLAGGNAFLWDSEHPRRHTYELLEAEARRRKKGVWRER